jgi:hypothetical protein
VLARSDVDADEHLEGEAEGGDEEEGGGGGFRSKRSPFTPFVGARRARRGGGGAGCGGAAAGACGVAAPSPSAVPSRVCQLLATLSPCPRYHGPPNQGTLPEMEAELARIRARIAELEGLAESEAATAPAPSDPGGGTLAALKALRQMRLRALAAEVKRLKAAIADERKKAKKGKKKGSKKAKKGQGKTGAKSSEGETESKGGGADGEL